MKFSDRVVDMLDSSFKAIDESDVYTQTHKNLAKHWLIAGMMAAYCTAADAMADDPLDMVANLGRVADDLLDWEDEMLAKVGKNE
jgi:hypothetical protein